MASLRAEPDRQRKSSRRVRIVGNIRGFTDQESQDSESWINVCKPQKDGDSAAATVSFQSTSRKDVYELDYCYERGDDIDLIFAREIKPLISEAFDGRDVSVIAFGARGSGKTYAIQGSGEKPGLAVMTVAAILSKAEDTKNLVSISCYEVSHDHAYDLLDPEHSEVQPLKDGQGKMNLKGLSQVCVKSLSEFQNLYFTSHGSCKPAQKIQLELPRRSHKVLIIRILSEHGNSDAKVISKINFVDLAGYEDARRNSGHGTMLLETTKINKSLYALLNVVNALNANESLVPYRESKLTHTLQDSLIAMNYVLVLTCLNPYFCQDTVYSTSLVSRLCQSNIRAPANSTQKSRGPKVEMLSSRKNEKPAAGSSSTVKKSLVSGKKSDSNFKGRKLFDGGKTGSCRKTRGDDASIKESSLFSDIPLSQVEAPRDESTSDFSATLVNKEDESVCSRFLTDTSSAVIMEKASADESTSDVSADLVNKGDESVCSSVLTDTSSSVIMEKDVTSGSMRDHMEVTPAAKGDCQLLTLSNADSKDSSTIGKENRSLHMNNAGSPPLSARLREISNNLKSLCYSTPSIKMPQEVVPSHGCDALCADNIEPKTPVVGYDMKMNDNLDITKYNSPWETFHNRSARTKDFLVHEFLKFLNTATKDELKGLWGIGEKRATYILELRSESAEPFKSLDDLQKIGLTGKQSQGMMKRVAARLFS